MGLRPRVASARDGTKGALIAHGCAENPMPPADRVEQIFTEAIAKPPEQRSAFLDQACAGDAALRERVAELLSVHDAAGDRLKRPADDRTVQPFVPLSEAPGAILGRYKLLEQI